MQPVTENPPVGNTSVAPGYIKFVRSPESEELIRDPKAFALLASIAFRARWRSGLGVDDVQLGEALIGDFHRAGMTRGEYREATKRLCKYRLATFRTTNRGTFAKLASSKVFDLNAGSPQDSDSQRNNQPATSEQPASYQPATSEQPLTKNERREEGEQGKKETRSPNEIERQVEAIYQAYPRKEHTADGKKAIRSALKLRSFDFLLERTQAYALSRIGNPKHPEFTPLPATFFNKRYYDDDPASRAQQGNNGHGTNGARRGQFPEDISRLRPLAI